MAEEEGGSPVSASGWETGVAQSAGPSCLRWLSLHTVHTSHCPKAAEPENLSGTGKDVAIYLLF